MHKKLVVAFGSTWITGCMLAVILCVWAGAPTLASIPALVGVLGVALGIGILSRRPALRWPAIVVALGGFGALSWVASPPSPAAGFVVQQRHLAGFAGGGPWFGAIPEDELIALGIQLLGTPDERAATIERGLFAQQAAENLAQQIAEPSNWVIDGLLRDRGHYRFARPAGVGPFPLLVFLHGNGGAFGFYAATIAPAALEAGYAVVFPTFGFGNWESAAGTARAIAVVEDFAANVAPIDRRCVIVGGISAGGMGAIRALGHAQGAFTAALAISGVPLDPLDASGAFDRQSLAGRHALVIHGTADVRIPIDTARRAQLALERAGAHAELREVDGDHFVFLTQRADVSADATAWLRARLPHD